MISDSPGFWTARITDDRSFKIDHLKPNRYGVLVGNLPDGFYVKSIRAGGVDETYSGIDLTSAEPGQIDILVSPKAGLVSGIARDSDTNQPFGGATVVLAPQETALAELPSLYQHASTDQYGRFRFRNVVPGKYYVYAWDDVETGAWMDPDFRKPLEDKAVSVTVAESAQADVQVNVIRSDAGT